MVLLYPRLDATTLVLAVAILAAMLATISISLARGDFNDEFSFRYWGASMGCGALTFFLWSFSGYWPFLLTFLVANLVAIFAIPLGIVAYARLFNVTPPRQFLWITVIFGLSGVFGTYFFGTSRGIAIFSMNAGLAIQLLMMVFMVVIRNRTKPVSSLSILAVITTSGLALMHASRAIIAVFGDFASVVPTGNSVTQILYYFAFTAFISASSIAFFHMNIEKNRCETEDRLRRDGLTGLYTRTAFFEMEKEIEQMGGTEGYALILADIDHFKAVNDNFGHHGGDVVLAHVGRLIAGLFRLSDISVRYGGEEFCVVLRGCGESDAAKFSERLVRESGMQSVRLSEGQSTKFTLSVGYACTAPSARGGAQHEPLRSVINRADQALYRAKKGGRNQALAAVMPNLSIIS
jgi:diguanylate cyclase (GGDEF)-like protein